MDYFKDDDKVLDNNHPIDFSHITIKSIEDINDRMKALHSQYDLKFFRAFEDAIESTIPYRIPSNVIENIKANYFDSFMNDYQNKLSNALERLISDSSKRLAIDISNKENSNDLFQRYCNYLKEGIVKIKSGRFDDDIMDFSRNATNQVRKYLVGYKGVDDNTRLDIKLDDLRQQIKYKFNRTFEMYLQDYSLCIKSALNSNLSSVKSMISQRKDSLQDNKKFELFKNVVAFGNFDLVQENGKYYLVNKTSNQKYTAVITDFGDLTTEENENIRFVLPDSEHKRIGYQDENVIIRVSEGNVQIVDSSRNKMRFVNLNGSWSLIYNDEEIKDPEAVGQVFDILITSAPGCYKIFSGIPFFMNLINQKKANEKDELYEKYASMFIDYPENDDKKMEDDGIVHESANRKAFR